MPELTYYSYLICSRAVTVTVTAVNMVIVLMPFGVSCIISVVFDLIGLVPTLVVIYYLRLICLENNSS